MPIDSDDSDKLPPTDFNNLRKSVEFRLIVEFFHKLFLISDEIYYNSYRFNAEILERDFKIWIEFSEIDEQIKES